MEDRNQAIESAEMAEALCPISVDQPTDNGAAFLFKLSQMYFHRFGHANNKDEIDSAVSISKRAHHLFLGNSDYLRQLASCLGTRYRHIRAREDLDCSLVLYVRYVMETAEKPNGSRASDFGFISALFVLRFERDNTKDDLDEAIRYLTLAAEDDAIIGGQKQSFYQQSVAMLLSQRFDHFRDHEDLNMAIERVEMVLHISPDDAREAIDAAKEFCPTDPTCWRCRSGSPLFSYNNTSEPSSWTT